MAAAMTLHSGFATMRQRYLDDFQPGETFESSPRTLTQQHFATFADMTGDAHPIHYDADYARAKGWDGPIAHGLMLLGLCALGAAPMIVLSEGIHAAVVASIRFGNVFRQNKSPVKTTLASGMKTTESPPVCPGKMRTSMRRNPRNNVTPLS